MAENESDLGKKPTERHIEHHMMLGNIELLMQRDEERTKEFSQWIVAQSEKNEQARIDFLHVQQASREEFISEVRTLERAIMLKTENDSAIMANSREARSTANAAESLCHETQLSLERTTAILERVEIEMKNSVDSAHTTLRDHSKRIKVLEEKALKTWVKIISYIGASLGTAGIALLIAWLSGILHL